jgi:hypothetical protein
VPRALHVACAGRARASSSCWKTWPRAARASPTYRTT